VRSQCTQSRHRTLSVRRREAHVALEEARQREQTEEFIELYAQRAGVEGVHAQGTRRMGLRRSRYIGEPRTHLQHVVIATAINVCRLHDWLAGVSPHPTPLSHFARLMKEVA
jgi:Transposase DDE domain